MIRKQSVAICREKKKKRTFLLKRRLCSVNSSKFTALTNEAMTPISKVSTVARQPNISLMAPVVGGCSSSSLERMGEMYRSDEERKEYEFTGENGLRYDQRTKNCRRC